MWLFSINNYDATEKCHSSDYLKKKVIITEMFIDYEVIYLFKLWKTSLLQSIEKKCFNNASIVQQRKLPTGKFLASLWKL